MTEYWLVSWLILLYGYPKNYLLNFKFGYFPEVCLDVYLSDLLFPGMWYKVSICSFRSAFI